MTTDVVATFEDGVFKPESPVDCLDHSRVRLRIEPLDFRAEPVATREQRDAALKRFLAWTDEVQFGSGGERLTRDQLYERD